MKERAPISEGNRRLLNFVGSTMAVAGTFVGVSGIGFEAQRVLDGDFCDDSVYTRNTLSEEQLRNSPDCAPDVMNGLATLLGGIGITVGVVTRKHARS